MNRLTLFVPVVHKKCTDFFEVRPFRTPEFCPKYLKKIEAYFTLSCLDIPLKNVVWTYNYFENNLAIKHNEIFKGKLWAGH